MNDFELRHVDVKSTYLNAPLKEEIYYILLLRKNVHQNTGNYRKDFTAYTKLGDNGTYTFMRPTHPLDSLIANLTGAYV